MQRGIVMTDDREDAKSILNNEDTHINRGFELLLRNRRRKPDPPKTFQVKFGKMISAELRPELCRYQTQPVYTHPEMFDENGNILPDEILAVRFENGYDEFDEEDDN